MEMAKRYFVDWKRTKVRERDVGKETEKYRGREEKQTIFVDFFLYRLKSNINMFYK